MLTKEIFGTPMSVARRIEESINALNQVIISIALERMHIRAQQVDLRQKYHVNEDWHKHDSISGPQQQGCGCVYCVALARYLNTKVAAHRLRKRLDDWYWQMPQDNSIDLKQLQSLEEEWPRLREAKNQIKAELGM